MGLKPGIHRASGLWDKATMPVNPFDNSIEQIFSYFPIKALVLVSEDIE